MKDLLIYTLAAIGAINVAGMVGLALAVWVRERKGRRHGERRDALTARQIGNWR
jgi:hypothetical protein